MSLVSKHPYPVTLLSSILALGLFLVLTNPNKVPVSALAVPILLIFFISFSASQMVMGRIRKRTNYRKKRTISLVFATLVTIVMTLQTSGGLSVADLIILVLIVVIAAIYIDKY